MQYKYLSEDQIKKIKKKDIKVTIWADKSIHSVLDGDLYFCTIHTNLPLSVIINNQEDTNDSFDLN